MLYDRSQLLSLETPTREWNSRANTEGILLGQLIKLSKVFVRHRRITRFLNVKTEFSDPLGRVPVRSIMCHLDRENCDTSESTRKHLSSAVRVRGKRASALAQETANLVLGVLVVLGSEAGSKAAEKDEDDEDDEAENNQLAQSGVAGAVFSPSTATLTKVLLELVGTELVVDETAESNAVTESLQTGDGVLENHHRGEDEQNILQHTGEGENKGRGLADLWGC